MLVDVCKKIVRNIIGNKSEYFNNKSYIITVILLTTAFLLITFGNKVNRYTNSDARCSILLSDTILTHRTIKLDHYGENFINSQGYFIGKDLLVTQGYVIQKKNGHYYYYFPIGTPIAIIPFVAIAKGFGFNIVQSEEAIQIAIAAVISTLILLFMIKLAQLFVSYLHSIIIASIFWFGTSLVSTCGTALWSHNLSTLFGLLAIYYTIKMTKNNNYNLWPVISITLFAAYLCRPTMLLLYPFILFYIFTYNKRIVSLIVGLIVFHFFLFISFSIYEFKQILPDYYLPQRISGSSFFQALYGNLLSPSRGLFIFSPFILFSWVCFYFSDKKWEIKKSWLLIAIAWPLLHLVAISKFPHWWGGWSFGSRFMTEAIPGIFLLSIYTWPIKVKGKLSQIFIVLLILSSVFSIYVNSIQGLYNPYTRFWNIKPDIQRYPQYLFDWKCPQFIVTKKCFYNRLKRHVGKYHPEIKPSEILDYKSEKILFLGWYDDIEDSYRLSSGLSSIYFNTNYSKDLFIGQIQINLRTLGKQKVTVLLNQREIYFNELHFPSFQTITIQFKPTLIRNGVNVIQFILQDARKMDKDDPRIVGLALHSISIK